MEKMPVLTRKKARIILFTSSLVIVLLISSVVQTVKANKYEQEATLAKQMALMALDENLNNISPFDSNKALISGNNVTE